MGTAIRAINFSTTAPASAVRPRRARQARLRALPATATTRPAAIGRAQLAFYLASFLLISGIKLVHGPQTVFIAPLGVVLPDWSAMLLAVAALAVTGIAGFLCVPKGRASKMPLIESAFCGGIAGWAFLGIFGMPSLLVSVWCSNAPIAFCITAAASVLAIAAIGQGVLRGLPSMAGKRFVIIFAIAGVAFSVLPIGEPARLETRQLPEQKATLAANIDTATKFFDGSWDAMTLQERCEALGTMADVLAFDLGMDRAPLRIVASLELGPNVYGDYNSDRGGTIRVNAAYLATMGALANLDTLSHEMAHAYQHFRLESGHPAHTIYPFRVDKQALKTYRSDFAGEVPYGERLIEQHANGFSGMYVQHVAKVVCKRLGIEDPFSIESLLAMAQQEGWAGAGQAKEGHRPLERSAK